MSEHILGGTHCREYVARGHYCRRPAIDGLCTGHAAERTEWEERMVLNVRDNPPPVTRED